MWCITDRRAAKSGGRRLRCTRRRLPTRCVGTSGDLSYRVQCQAVTGLGIQVSTGDGIEVGDELAHAGVSGFPCSRRVEQLHGRSNDPICIKDSELVHGRLPIMRDTSPIRGDVAQRQPEQLDGRLVIREVATGLDDLAQLHVQALDGVCNRHDIAGASRSRAEWFERMVCPSGTWGTGEHFGWAGRFYTMIRELVLVVGRPCDPPGCAASANP